jgi:hypothetical protein
MFPSALFGWPACFARCLSSRLSAKDKTSSQRCALKTNIMQKKTMTHPIGNFKIESGKVLITDPCYYHEKYSEADGVNAKKGLWKAYALEVYDESWGNRITMLYAHHQDYPKAKLNQPGWIDLEYGTGVDSGQAGFFDLQYFNDSSQIKEKLEKPLTGKNLWYDYCCHQTLDTEIGAGTIPFGVVSSSGLGDGYYPAFGQKDGEEWIALAIDFQVVPNTFTIPALSTNEQKLFEAIESHQLNEELLMQLQGIDLPYFVNYCLYKAYEEELALLLRVLGPETVNMDYLFYHDLFDTFDRIKYDLLPFKDGAEILDLLKHKEEKIALKWSNKLVEIGFMENISNKNILDQLLTHLYQDNMKYIKFWIDQGLKASPSKLTTEVISSYREQTPKIAALLENTREKWAIQVKDFIGQIVQIKSGPFANFQGTVIAHLEDKNLYQIEVNLFGRDSVVEVNSDQFDLLS